MQIKMKQLLHYRNIWLGCAMLWIALSHSGFHFPSRIFSYLKNWGYGGVDICLLASGLGCYFSLDKDSDALRFLKRRVERLVPTYLCFIGVWAVCKYAATGLPFRAVLGNILGVQQLTGQGNAFNWYIGGLVVLYILAPYLKALVDRMKAVRGHLLVLMALVLGTVPFWDSQNLIIIVTRIPIFYIGMLLGKLCKQDRQVNSQTILLSVAVMVIGIVSFWVIYPIAWEVLWSYGLYWYPFILITPGLCVVLTLMAMGLEKCGAGRRILRMLECIGKNSFEVYLVHLLMYETLIPWMVSRTGNTPGNLFWFATIPVIVIGCMVLKAVTKAVSGFLRRRPAAL